MIKHANNTVAAGVVADVLRAAKSEEVRSMREFAEAEVVLPMDGGKYQGQPFDADAQPISALIFDELDRHEFAEYYFAAPSQSGKTFTTFVVPAAYQACEVRRNFVVAVPDGNMADDKFRVDIRPIFDESPALKDLLPKRGPGSRGGTIKNTLTFTNDVVAKFLTPFGDDSNKAGFTGTFVFVTEAARFSKASATSVEADALRQIKARMLSQSVVDDDGEINTDRLIIVEGTVTVDDELPQNAKAGSTETRVACPCPHCRTYVTPEREHLRGWQTATSEWQAIRESYYVCPNCDHAITEDERAEMNRRAVLVHKGETIDRAGRKRGKRVETLRFWLRWNAFNNLFRRAGDVGREEWIASQIDEDTEERELAEKALCQQTWALTYRYVSKYETIKLKPSDIQKRRDDWPRGVLPPDTTLVTAGIDIGLHWLWYTVLAFRESGLIHCVDYGNKQTGLIGEQPAEVEDLAIRQAVEELVDTLMLGFPVAEAARIRKPSRVFIDSRYKQEPIYDFCKQAGTYPALDLYQVVWPILGYGHSQLETTIYNAPKVKTKRTRRIGDGWHIVKDKAQRIYVVELDADRAKTDIQETLRVQLGAVGSLSLFANPEKHHTLFGRHLSSEVFQLVDTPDGPRKKWKKTGANHLLDSSGYALKAAHFHGWRPADYSAPTEDDSEDDDQPATDPAPPATGSFAAAIGVGK